jgi:hypothetical protein
MSRNGNKKSPKPKRPKTRLGLPDLDHSRSAVLDGLRSRESKRGYSQAFGIDFPKPSATITKGISDRHDIVHRTGKSPNSVMGSWDMAQILVLKDDVAQYGPRSNACSKCCLIHLLPRNRQFRFDRDVVPRSHGPFPL